MKVLVVLLVLFCGPWSLVVRIKKNQELVERRANKFYDCHYGAAYHVYRCFVMFAKYGNN